MKKIDKSKKLALEYHLWVASLVNPPEYYSSHKYYKDVLINLLCCQDGLCAYTEFRLIEDKELKRLQKLFDPAGKYLGERPEGPADIEHFCSEIKKENGWRWANLFAAFSYINIVVKRVGEQKLRKETGEGVKDYLKPDHADYSPEKYLEYDYDEHRFNPRIDLEDSVADDVMNMIHVLGLNNGFIKMERKEYITPKIEQLKAGNETTLYQFHTSYKMVKDKLFVL